jgi:hypothetical protein
MRLNRGGQPDSRAQVEGPQVKYIVIGDLAGMEAGKVFYDLGKSYFWPCRVIFNLPLKLYSTIVIHCLGLTDSH